MLNTPEIWQEEPTEIHRWSEYTADIMSFVTYVRSCCETNTWTAVTAYKWLKNIIFIILLTKECSALCQNGAGRHPKYPVSILNTPQTSPTMVLKEQWYLPISLKYKLNPFQVELGSCWEPGVARCVLHPSRVVQTVVRVGEALFCSVMPPFTFPAGSLQQRETRWENVTVKLNNSYRNRHFNQCFVVDIWKYIFFKHTG